ncbi:uncharacterized protein LOC144820335 [Lissotriton helveticus]
MVSPISLLNTDYKIFAGVLAARLAKVIKTIVHEDQRGFMPGRQINELTFQAITAIDYAIDKKLPLTIVAIDAAKAFDQSWSRELEKQTPQTKPLDLYKLRVEIEELMAGNVGLDRLNTYSEEELSFICKSFTRNTRVLHEKLTETAVSMGVDISKSKPLQKPYRADFSDKDIEHLNVAGKKLQIKELMGVLQKWGDVEKWRSRWAKKREEVRSRQVTPEFALREVEKPEQLCPMREVPGGKYVHVPWSRQDIVSFTNDFPKLREKPVDWYRQVERFVKVQKCLWKDLDGFFDIVVPVDLWTQCKIAIDWPSEEYPRNKETGEPSKDVMRKYEQVIQHLKEKVPAKETDWTKIDRTTQERDETVHSFYERLLQVFKTYSGIDNIDLKDMTHFIYRFVNGLRPEICQWIKDNKICWHTKKMDEVLRYAKYCEDEMAEKKKALKEKVMWAQVKLAEQQEKQLSNARIGAAMMFEINPVSSMSTTHGQQKNRVQYAQGKHCLLNFEHAVGIFNLPIGNSKV